MLLWRLFLMLSISILKLFRTIYRCCQKIHKNSFTRKNSGEEEEYKEVKDKALMKGLCGICKQKWTAPVLLKCSVYVYCKQCLEEHVRNVGKCPQTGVPVTLGQVVKFFNSNFTMIMNLFPSANQTG